MKREPIYIIAEVGQAHDGSLGILHSYIDAVSKTGVDAIKFQTHIAEAESSKYEPFRINFSYEDNTRFDYWNRMSFSLNQWQEIKSHCDEVGLDFISSPFSLAAVELLEKVGVSKYKIGSGEVSNYLMLDFIAETKKPVILSSGLSCYKDLDAALIRLSKHGSAISILQCTTKYPTQPEDIGLNVIKEIRDRYDLPVGLSDHSGTIFPSLAAASLGAELLEAHVVFDRRMFGPDTASSLEIDDFSLLVNGVRAIEKMLSSPVNKYDYEVDNSLKTMFEKSLAVNCDLTAGSVIKKEYLESKKPAGKGIAASSYESVIGKKLKSDLPKWAFLNAKDLYEN